MPLSSALSFNDIDSAYASDVSQLPAIGEAMLKPDATAHDSGSLRGWIDIVGYQNTAKINGVYYYSGTLNPVVRNSVYINVQLPGSVDSFTSAVSTTQNGNTLIATMTAELVWHTYACNKHGCFPDHYYTNVEYFTDTETMPVQIPAIVQPELIAHEYTEPNRTILNLNLDNLITYYNITNRNGSLERYEQIGQISYTDKGVPYLNFTKQLPMWKHAGSGIYQQGTDVMLENSNFTFNARTPFGDVGEPNITVIKEPPTSFSEFSLMMIGYVLFAGWICKMMLKQVKI
jgi:hypothetical protein